MGLLKHLLFWPVTGPEFLVRYSLAKVESVVHEELTDDQAIKEELMVLQMRLELGEIDDDEYVDLEAALMQRLRDVRHWREEFGMGTSGGPVQVRREEESASRVDGMPAGAVAKAVGKDVDPLAEEGDVRHGIASPDGATVEFDVDWE